MKTQLLIAAIILSATTYVAAQNYCGSLRYDTEVFTGVTTTSNITYGSNIDAGGNAVTLTLDVYEPTGDTATIRPMIIWVHGGSFIGGTKTDGDVVSLSQHFARRGYVCVSIEYRLGFGGTFNQAGATKAVYRAVQDMKAAVRFFRQDAATVNQYKIDPNMIFGGGSSAGAITALHLAYLDQYSELPSAIDTSVMGSIEGNSGNPGYPSEINAVINLCGALGDTTWLNAGDEPLCSMHGTIDNVVPYSHAMLYLFGVVPIMIVDGSYAINDHATAAGVSNVMYTYFGGDHVPYAGDTAYMDTTVRFVSNFLYATMGCVPSDPNPMPNTFINVSATDLEPAGDMVVYPNPSNGTIHIRWNGSGTILHYSLTDIAGKKLVEIFNEGSTEILLPALSPGIYFLKAVAPGKSFVTRVVIGQ